MNARVVIAVIVKPLLASIAAALVFGIFYPLGWPEQAGKPDDPVGYWLGSLGIPAVGLLVLIRERKKLQRSES